MYSCIHHAIITHIAIIYYNVIIGLGDAWQLAASINVFTHHINTSY